MAGPGGASVALERLRNDPAARDQLIALAVDTALDRPVRDLFAVQPLASALGAAIRQLGDLEPALPSDHPLHAWIEARLHDPRPLGDHLPPGVAEAVDPILGVPWTPSEDLVLRLLRHDAARSLVRETLASTLRRFATRARALDEGVLKGLGGQAFKRGRGLLGQVGSAAEGLVGAVGREVEQALEGRIKEFLGGATDEALRGIAAWIADPAHAEPLARLRVSAWAELRATAPAELVGTAADDITAWERALHDGLSRLAGHGDLEDHLAASLQQGLDELGDTPIADWLPEPALRGVLHEAVASAAATGLTTLVQSEAFAAWWHDLHR